MQSNITSQDFTHGRLQRLLEFADFACRATPAGQLTLRYDDENDSRAVHSRASDLDSTFTGRQVVLLADELRESQVIRAGAQVFRSNNRNSHVAAIDLDKSAGWGVGSANDVQPSTLLTELNQRRCHATITYSTQMAINGGVPFAKHLYLQLHHALAAAIDRAAFAGSGTNDEPLGLLNDPGITGHVIADPFDISDLFLSIAEAEADLCEAWIDNPQLFTSPQLRRKMRASLLPDPAAAAPVGIESLENAMPHPPIRATGALGGMSAILGDFRNLAIAHGGEIHLLINPFSRDSEGMIRMSAWMHADVVAARPSAFARFAPAPEA